MKYCNLDIKFLFILFILTFAQTSYGYDVKVTGNSRIESATIKSFFTNINSQKDFNKALKRLHETKIFSDIHIKKSDDSILINIKENPLVNEIFFIGNKKLDSEVLLKELTLESRAVYTKSTLRKDLHRLIEIYKRSGRVNVKISPRVKFLSENRINIIFDIQENEKVKIEKIFFHNNKIFDSEKLKDLIISKEAKWYRPGKSYYDPDKLLYDQELLKRYYHNAGYADFKVESTNIEFAPLNSKFYINFLLDEGEIYFFDNISIITKNELVNLDKIEKKITFKQFDKFSYKELEETRKQILNYLNLESFAYANIEFFIKKNETLKTINVEFEITNDFSVFVNKININGNTRTYDKVIRNRLKINEGDLYNVDSIAKTKKRIENLGFFSKVDIQQNSSKKLDAIDLDIDVIEKPTGELNFGLGYSTTDKFLGNISVKERNLMGMGHTLYVDFQKSSLSDQIDFSYKIPNFQNYNFNLGVEVFDIRREYDQSDASVHTRGVGANISYSFNDNLYQTLAYKLKMDNIFDVDDDATIYITEQEGKTSTSQISQTLSLNKLNNRFSPTEGFYIKYKTIIAGLGGDAKYLIHELSANKYIPLYKDILIFKASTKMGQIVGFDNYDVKINNRFFLGGSSLRGFSSSGVGPRDSDAASLGGNYLFKTTFETIFPIGLPEELGIKASIFTDIGTVFGLDKDYGDVYDTESLRLSAGVGIFWSSPLGPIRLDFGRAILKESFDKTENFRISFGLTF